MKRYIVLFLAILILLTFTGCTKSLQELRMTQAQEYITPAGFEIIKMLNHQGDYYIFLVYDTDTKAEYILTWGSSTHGLCPYYDENGNVTFYGGH